MQITLYGDGTLPLHKSLIEKLEEHGFAVLFDAEHGSDIDYLKQYYGSTPHRLFLVQGTTLFHETVENLLSKVTIDLACSFSQELTITTHDWECIIQYFKSIFFNYPEPRLTRRLTSLIRPPVKSVSFAPTPTATNLDPCYEFEKSIFEDRNIAFFQITKPVRIVDTARDQVVHYDKSAPYTIIVQDFVNRGYYPIFWSLFICESWGTNFADIKFLQELWVQLGMDIVYGKFDLDDIIKTGQEESKYTMPIVYRKSIAEVIEQRMKKDRGTEISK